MPDPARLQPHHVNGGNNATGDKFLRAERMTGCGSFELRTQPTTLPGSVDARQRDETSPKPSSLANAGDRPVTCAGCAATNPVWHHGSKTREPDLEPSSPAEYWLRSRHRAPPYAS